MTRTQAPCLHPWSKTHARRVGLTLILFSVHIHKHGDGSSHVIPSPASIITKNSYLIYINIHMMSAHPVTAYHPSFTSFSYGIDILSRAEETGFLRKRLGEGSEMFVLVSTKLGEVRDKWLGRDER